jgi:hypothetical protein
MEIRSKIKEIFFDYENEVEYNNIANKYKKPFKN